jgi:hypothetical protein
MACGMRGSLRLVLLIVWAACGCGSESGSRPLAATRPAATQAVDLTKEARRRCFRSLHAIRKGFDDLATRNPNAWSHLGPGQIDEADLSLHFPLRDSQRKPLEHVGRGAPPYRPPRRSGIFVWFESSPKRDGLEPVYSLRWPVIGLTFSWSWSWTGAFPDDGLSGFQRVIREAVRPLAELEANAVVQDVSAHNKGAYVLRGEASVELTIRMEDAPSGMSRSVVAMYLTNTTDKTLAVCPPHACVVIQDGVVLVDRLLPTSTSLSLPGYGLGQGPFIYLAPGESRKVDVTVLGRLGIGEHTVRIVQEYTQTDWLDMRPIAYDGAPVRREIANAWTGIVVSQELSIKVPSPTSAPRDR